MGKVIPFKAKTHKNSELMQMVQIADEIDEIILHYLNKGVDAKDIAGLLSHRLGTMLRYVESRSQLWGVCEKVLRKQAGL